MVARPLARARRRETGGGVIMRSLGREDRKGCGAEDARECVPTRREALARGLRLGAAAALLPQLVAARDAAAAEPTPPPAPSIANPDQALAALRAGNERYSGHKPQVRSTEQIESIWTETALGQAPFATVLGCADSRLSPELIFDQFVGDIFVVREAGNIASSPTNLGSLEFGQAVLGSKLILVLGHTSCGAVKAALAGDKPGGNIQAIVDAIAPGIAGSKTLEEATVANVRAVQKHIRERSPLLAKAESDGKIRITGGVYDIATGVVTFLPA
jgi:carbonic anhydrase